MKTIIYFADRYPKYTELTYDGEDEGRISATYAFLLRKGLIEDYQIERRRW